MNWSLCKIYEFSLFFANFRQNECFVLKTWIILIFSIFFLLIFRKFEPSIQVYLYLIQHFSCLILCLVSKIFYSSGQIIWNFSKIHQVLRKIKNTVLKKFEKVLIFEKIWNFWSEISEMKKIEVCIHFV
jgi:hypothetical protein